MSDIKVGDTLKGQQAYDDAPDGTKVMRKNGTEMEKREGRWHGDPSRPEGYGTRALSMERPITFVPGDPAQELRELADKLVAQANELYAEVQAMTAKLDAPGLWAFVEPVGTVLFSDGLAYIKGLHGWAQTQNVGEMVIAGETFAVIRPGIELYEAPF